MIPFFIRKDAGETMKLFHISDLHLGKRIYEFSMLEEQRELLLEILRSIDEEQPQALLISGIRKKIFGLQGK